MSLLTIQVGIWSIDELFTWLELTKQLIRFDSSGNNWIGKWLQFHQLLNMFFLNGLFEQPITISTFINPIGNVLNISSRQSSREKWPNHNWFKSSSVLYINPVILLHICLLLVAYEAFQHHKQWAWPSLWS